MPTTIDEIIASADIGNRDSRDNPLVSLALYVKRAETAIVTQLGAVIADVAVLRGERREATAQDVAPLDEVSRYRIALLAIGDIVDCFSPVSPEADDPNAWHLYAARIKSAVEKKLADRDVKPANPTVADAIDTRVIEYQDADGDWCQMERNGCAMRAWDGDASMWLDWFDGLGYYTADIAQPCRLAEREDADASPETRGPIGGQATE